MLISNGYVNVNITKADENRLRISITGNLLIEARRIWFVCRRAVAKRRFFRLLIRIIKVIRVRANVMQYGAMRLLYFTDKYRESIREDYRVYE